jgi:serine/threonine protein kinase
MLLCPAGTIAYMPTELLLTGRMTTATDIYSFGVISEWQQHRSREPCIPTYNVVRCDAIKKS